MLLPTLAACAPTPRSTLDKHPEVGPLTMPVDLTISIAIPGGAEELMSDFFEIDFLDVETGKVETRYH
jgi:hypothetical protein